MSGWVGELSYYRWNLARYLLLGFLVLAPFVIWGPVRVAHKAAYILIAIGLCLLGIASRLTFVLSCLVLIAPALLHQHLSRHWGRGQLDARFEAILESPSNEIREYIQSHVDKLDIVFVVASVLYVIFLFRWTFRSGDAPSSLRWVAAILIAVGLVGCVGLRLDRYLIHFLPYEMVAQAAKAKNRYAMLSLRTEILEQRPLPVRACRLHYEKIVIVFGESAVSDHMSIFGYPKSTTPFAERSGAHAIDSLSPSNQTRYALGMMLTPAAPGAFDTFYRSHSLVGELRQCGLHTLWISNQGRRGEYDSFATSMALEADEQVFLNEWSWTDSGLDGKVIEELAARRAYDKRGQVTFIHLIGSHPDYVERVPAGFGSSDTSNVVANYDNTIRYTDQVLSDLYRRFADDSLLFIYVSDHGQIVTDDLHGSGFLPGYKEEYRTPLLIWTEDHAAIAKLRDAIGEARLNLESFDDVVRYLVGLSQTPKVSTRQAVSVLTPDKVTDYADLESLSGD